MSNAEKALVEQLATFMAEAGFKWLKARAMFVRKELYGFSSLSWEFYWTGEGGGRLELVPLLAVRHNMVEGVVNELGLVYGEANRRFTATVDRGLGFFPFKEGRDEKRYISRASVDADVEYVASSIASMLSGEGEMFFKKYSSLLECSRGLNDPIESITHPLCNNFPRRVYLGVAAAFFAENKRVPELIAQYLAFAKVVQPSQYGQIAKRLDQLMLVAQSKR
ncbi:MAG: hypothetical protein ACRES5_34720 [Pseudomonas sp.]|uniref:hypothetical protein n=1 Tax=Stenotrophomonas sp. TaxID=69392 RepID=UPI003D6CAD72